MTRSFILWLGAAALLAAAASQGLAAGGPPDPDAAGLTPAERQAALVARSAWEHARLETLEAAFTQRQESLMLVAPEESEGTFSYRAPGSMRWDFISPPLTTVVHDGTLITWYRDLERAERRTLGRRADRMLKLLGPGASLADLERYFTLAAELPAAAQPYRVRLEPRSARIARRIRSIDMELDRQLLVPVFLRFVDADGGVTELRFRELRVNGSLPADRFDLELPAGVAVTSPP